MEAAVAALEAAAKRTARAATAAKEAAVAASAAATEAAGVASAAKEAVAAALATAEQAAAASSRAKEFAMAAEAAAKESAADAAATAEELAAAMRYSKKRRFHHGGSGGGNPDDGRNLDLVSASPTRSSAASSTCFWKEPAAAVAATAKEPAVETRYSKKPRFHQIDNGGSGGGGNCDDGGNLDLISALPDEVLGSIITLLPTEDGARTQAISRRWLPLWRSAPLNLVVNFEMGLKQAKIIGSVSNTNSKLVASVSKILSEHRGPARRLSLKLICATDIPVWGWERKIEEWLRSQALDGLQELDFNEISGMPLSVFRFAPTLRFARFIVCGFPKSISTLCLNFPCLKQLTMYGVSITEDGLHSMLSGCTALESLELKQIYGIGGLCISSQTLRSFAFHRDYRQNILHLVIKDAPSLERLLPLNPCSGRVAIQVIWAPKLEILGLLSKDLYKVQFGTTIFRNMIAVSLTTKIETMKVLVLDSIGPSLDAVVDFLKCFPCLVRLYVISHPTKDMDNARKYDPLDPIECLEHHLKKVVLMNYDGNKRPSVDFAKFFVLNTKFLKEMEIEVLNNRNDKWMANHRKQLCVEKRASRDARIELKISTKKSNILSMDTHDLSMFDPFSSRAFR
ncbi:F-box/FBD/LRR-repeat protein At2g04230-like [Lolium rigidum]|uniref:F-box/FBD/LRR-repeat protein At2g04230-like n=1 Tax=Lolium rigidum TaxID=89674 RepID=UPI001F5CA0C1|nr:F-box/FBD/LRR-repeat protein At2g04230-like [Lolium rigidum]